jgi:predicted DNA-binding protein (UPF0251 family)
VDKIVIPMRFRKGRPKIPRLISEEPRVVLFKPAGTPTAELEVLNLTLEELESVRLVDYMGYSHEEAANAMGISRRVFWSILKSARKKIVDVLINGKALSIGGGHYQIRECGSYEECGREKRCRFRLLPCKKSNSDLE